MRSCLFAVLLSLRPTLLAVLLSLLRQQAVERVHRHTAQAIRMHPGSVPVEDNGYRVLKALARTEEGKLKILAAGGMEVLRVATCQHPGGPHVNPATWG